MTPDTVADPELAALSAVAATVGIGLGAPVPLVDGQRVTAESPVSGIRPAEGQDGRFELVLDPSTGRCSKASPPLSFGVRIPLTGVVRWLRMGYHSWDGSAFEEVHSATDVAAGVGDDAEDGGPSGFAVTQLASTAGYLQLGFVRHDRLQHRFRLHRTPDGIALDIEVLWDRRPVGADASSSWPASETLDVTAGPRVEPLLTAWADTVARSGPTPRRAEPITGWCSWYNLYASITEDNLREHLAGVRQVAQEDDLPMRVFQIDDGFTPEMGDWLETRPTFPHGMQPLLGEIADAGFRPGLWIAPFLVGNRSRLYADHPDWVVVDRLTDTPYVCMAFYGEFRWHKRSEEYYLLDTTHPDAMAYLRRVFRTWRDWGCLYVKTDFMFYAAEHGPERFRRHREGLGRAEVFVDALRAIREELGDVWWLGCGVPLWMSVGYVDAARVGRDVGAQWDTGVRAEEHFETLSLRAFAGDRLWLADPDCVLLREHYHQLSLGEVTTLAITAGMAGGVVMTSDDLAAIGPERRALWSFVLSLASGHCTYPLLGGSAAKGLLVQWRPDEQLLHVVNTGPDERSAMVAWAVLGLTPDEHGIRLVEPGRPATSSAAGGRTARPRVEVTSSGLEFVLARHAGILVRVD